MLERSESFAEGTPLAGFRQALTVPTFMFRKGYMLERSESFAAQPQALTVPTFMFRKGGVLERSESFASSPQGKFRNRTGSFPSCLL